MQSRMTQTNGSPEFPGRFIIYSFHYDLCLKSVKNRIKA